MYPIREDSTTCHRITRRFCCLLSSKPDSCYYNGFTIHSLFWKTWEDKCSIFKKIILSHYFFFSPAFPHSAFDSYTPYTIFRLAFRARYSSRSRHCRRREKNKWRKNGKPLEILYLIYIIKRSSTYTRKLPQIGVLEEKYFSFVNKFISIFFTFVHGYNTYKRDIDWKEKKTHHQFREWRKVWFFGI